MGGRFVVSRWRDAFAAGEYVWRRCLWTFEDMDNQDYIYAEARGGLLGA